MLLLISIYAGILLISGIAFTLGWVMCMFWMAEPDNYMKVKKHATPPGKTRNGTVL